MFGWQVSSQSEIYKSGLGNAHIATSLGCGGIRWQLGKTGNFIEK